MNKKKILLILFFLHFTSLLIAQGDLMVFPKRLVFNDTKNRVQNVNLSNIGKDTATYKLSYNEIKMDQNGQFIPIVEPEPNQHFASPYLRFYPRVITLAPNESQTVKIQLIKTNELQEGEYRSHLYFRSVPKNNILKKVDSTNNKEGLSISIKPIYGISISNIITIGTSTTVVTLSNLAVEQSEKEIILSLDFNRNGNMSCYGDIQVNYISDKGIKTTVANVKGFAVYAPGNLRKTKIKLNINSNIDYSKGQLLVTYSPQVKNTKYAEAVLRL